MYFHVMNKRQLIAWLLLIMLAAGGVALGLDRLAAWTLACTEENEEPPYTAAFAQLPLDSQTPLPEMLEATPTPNVKQVNLFAPPEEEGAVPEASFSAEPEKTPSLSEEQTAQPASGELQIQVVRRENAETGADGKKILIYHTHTYEAYEPTKEHSYQQTEKWRTKDETCNVVRVGEELSRLLSALGYTVVHDTGAYEPPVLSTSYTRSLAMLEKRVSNGESYDLYIDLHRDAYTQSMEGQNVVQVNDLKLAKVMMLIGKGTGQSFDQKPDWEKNYEIAEMLTNALNEQVDGLCRRISLKSARFNQHIAPRCVLIEVGNNMNTLEEALASMPYVADAIDLVLKNREE